jgi:glutamine cyclotransferase
VLATHPHDPDAFTQGLVVRGSELIESTGHYGFSTLRAVDPTTGRIRTRTFLPPDVFGEGATILGDKIYVLTWRERIAFVYGLDFLQRGQIPYDTEGWGLTNDGTFLIMSDGSSTLRWLEPSTFKVVKSVRVREGGRDVEKLNELELIHGRIWANVWETNRIVQIAPDTGDVVGELDLSALDAGYSAANGDAVLNGIAFDAARDRVYVTGKFWPKMFEIAAGQ